MSEDDTQRGPERPMLILGDDRPDVEDTTPEELRRQQEEARREIERQRRELQEEIDRKRREAEREIAELERTKERELAQRERELDRTHKKLYQRESRLLRRTGSSGATRPTERLVRPLPRRPLRERGLRGSGRAWSLAVVAALGLGIAGVTAGAGSDEDLGAELAATDQARVLFLRAGLAADEAIAQRMVGQPVPAPQGGSVPGEAFATEAVTLVPDAQRYGERIVERTEELVSEETGTVRALTLWSQVHDEAAYAVPGYEVNELREEATDQGSTPTALAVIGLLALLLLLALAVVAQSWVAVAVLAVATVLGVTTVPAVLSTGGTGVEEAAADHGAASEAVRDLYDQVGRDLQAAYGTSTSSFAGRAGYWSEDPFYDVPASPGLTAYLDAREAVGEAEGEEATYAAAAGLAQAGRAAVEERLPAVEEARGRLVDGLEQSGPRALTVLLGLGGAALAVAGVALSRGRREEL